ncbi:cysteine-rich repeat secretory protein 55 [Telopea speciosissima]|uniref:cysteine-rich repeat secretory protein 55 n=1 Tax=Telopea speciosissima TaxID=54955 RepID=UPI001CC3391E|nr:cysteine-rich repeat secretory protein 55 [Telopea speciosissima]
MAALFYFLFLLLIFLPQCSCSTTSDRWGEFCNKEKNITSSLQSANIHQVLSELASKTAASDGFITTSSGTGKDKIYGLAQCRGDVSKEDCSQCTKDATKQLPQLCPNQSDARIWFEYCFLRYDIHNFIGEVDTSFSIIYYNVQNVTDPDPETFDKDLGALMDQVKAEALDLKNKGLGKGESKLTPYVTLYALVQCNRDLSQLSCAQCLAIAIENLGGVYCRLRKGCRVLYSSCYVRYELYPFFYPLSLTNNVNKGSLRVTTMYGP